MSNDTLSVAEHFYSIQGEGATAGKRAVFLRLQACNLMCGGNGTQLDGKLHDGATWRCDTIDVWLKGRKYTHIELFNLFEQENYNVNFRDGAHLVVTGGEPVLQQASLTFFLSKIKIDTGTPFVELETNGTISPSEDLLEQINQINCSPKLSNSGMSLEKRYKKDVLRNYVDWKNTYWKFVVSRHEDLEEIETDFLSALKIDAQRVYIMPAASSREELNANSLLCVEACKAYGFNYSSRLQVQIWDKTTGV